MTSISYEDYVIKRDGTLETGREEHRTGSHARQVNGTSLGICMIGGSDGNGGWENNFLPEQFDTLKQIVETLLVYPSVKGVQILNDMGSYMFLDYQDRWIPDTPELRRKIIKNLTNWNEFSNSSPAEGITTAIEAFYEPNKR